MAGEEAPRDPVAELAGSSLQVYLYLLEKGAPAGVREVQRALGFRSPSTARHHLERLVELGLARRVSGGYVAVRPSGFLGEYVVLRGRLVPRAAFAAGFTAAATAVYALLPGSDPVAVAVLAAASLLQAWAAASLYRAVPRRAKRGRSRGG